jgi:AcrR family transcriptional regulator
MQPVPEMPKIYQAHRENQLERILGAAEELFIRDGIDNVSMGAIAETARIARKTLYQYYPNKQEIALAIFQKFLDARYVAFDQNQIPEGSGFQRIEYLLQDMVTMLETYPEHIRFMVEFNTLYAREGNPVRVRQVYAFGGDLFIQWIRQGIEDRSICPNLDPEFLSAAIFNLVSGMNSRFALLGNQIGEEFGKPALELYREICRIFLRGIQNTPGSQENSG